MKCGECNVWMVICPCCDTEFCPQCNITSEELEEQVD